MDHEKRETLGQAVLGVLNKTPDSRDPIEITQAMGNKEYIIGLNKCVEQTLQGHTGDFFVTAIRVEVPLMHKKAYKLLFKSRFSCPSPQYDEDAWHFHSNSGSLEFLWSVPDYATCHYLKNNALEVAPEERQLRDFAIAMLDGSLLDKSKRLNGEQATSNLLEK